MYQAVLIDDEPFVLESLSQAIDWSGFHLEIGLTSTDPVSALDFILTHPVDLVITDVSMPVLNGMQLIQRIKQVKPSVYVIVLSAFNNFEYVKSALRYGAENYLLKPLDPDELSDTISQIVHHLREREQMTSTYGRSMMTFRSAFTEQWLKNVISGNDLLNKADMLGVNLNCEHFTAAVFSCPEGHEQSMSRFFDLLLHYLPGHYLGNFYFETPLKLVCVLSPYTQESKGIREFLTPVIRHALSDRLPVFASIGTTVNHYSHVPQSYQQACSLSFLKDSGLTFAFCEASPQLLANAKAAVECYEESGDPRSLEPFFEENPVRELALQILSLRIHDLMQKQPDSSQSLPEVTELLHALPSETAKAAVWKHYTSHFLEHTAMLLTRTQQPVYPMVDAVIRRVQEFSDKDISLKTLASKLNVSPSYLGTAFRQQTGCYFNDYLTDARLKYAANLLENTDLKIKDIVDRIGFSSQTYFNRAFKRSFGTSPVNYRRERKMKELQGN